MPSPHNFVFDLRLRPTWRFSQALAGRRTSRRQADSPANSSHPPPGGMVSRGPCGALRATPWLPRVVAAGKVFPMPSPAPSGQPQVRPYRTTAPSPEPTNRYRPSTSPPPTPTPRPAAPRPVGEAGRASPANSWESTGKCQRKERRSPRSRCASARARATRSSRSCLRRGFCPPG